MTLGLHMVTIEQCLPLCREDVFTDVISKKLYGEVTKVWCYPGHIVVTTDNGRKLFTFDCKPIVYQNVFSNKCLDLPNLTIPVVGVCMISASVLLVVEQKGNVQCWKFTTDSSWLFVGSTELCTNGTTVDSVIFLPGSNKLMWCESQISSSQDGLDCSDTENDEMLFTHIVQCRGFSPDVSSQSFRKDQDSAVTTQIIHNCPPCDLAVMTSGIAFIMSRWRQDLVTTHLVFDVYLDQMTFYIGSEHILVPNWSAHEGLNYCSLLSSSLATIRRTTPGQGDLGFRADSDQGKVIVLNSDGQTEIFSCIPEARQRRVSRDVVSLPIQDEKQQLKHWFFHKHVLGTVCNGGIRIFSLETGSQLLQWTCNDLTFLTSVISCSSPAFMAFVLTTEGLFAIQSRGKRMSGNPAEDSTPKDDSLQTEALQLAHLQQLKRGVYNENTMNKLANLKKSWSQSHGSGPSQITETLAPFLSEFWRLDELAESVKDDKNLTVSSEHNPSFDLVTELTSHCNSKRVCHSNMLWLSQVHPHQLLDHLCQGISLSLGYVVEGELPKWQALLGLDGGDLTKFEFVCRLLFQIHPEKLFQFVKCAESVSEQTIGVEAFVRKKHTLMFYKSACECLPEVQTSCKPQEAAAVQAKLILSSGGVNSVDQALKHMLKHNLWSDALDLLKTEAGNKATLPSYLFMTITALAQNQVLSDYIRDIFSIMPSWKSFLSFAKVATEKQDIRQQQLSSSVSDIFFKGHPDVNLASVKPFLQELMQDQLQHCPDSS